MSYHIVTKPNVYLDISEALAYYYPINPKLANDFLNRIEQAKNKIANNPKAFQIKHSTNIRTLLLEQFPYLLYFLIDKKNTIVILAILHAKSGQNKISKRV